jgi:hypothetical protein
MHENQNLVGNFNELVKFKFNFVAYTEKQVVYRLSQQPASDDKQ